MGTSTNFWGDDRHDGTLKDLINSVAIIVTNATTDGNLDIALLAPDRAELGTTLAETEINGGFIRGVWRFSGNDSEFDSATLIFSYDAADLSVAEEGDLKLYKSSGRRWIEVSTMPGVTVSHNDAMNKITASGLQEFSYFAIGDQITGKLASTAPSATILLVR